MTSGRLSLSKDRSANSNLNALQNGQNGETSVSDDTEQASLDDVARVKRIVKRMRIQVSWVDVQRQSKVSTTNPAFAARRSGQVRSPVSSSPCASVPLSSPS
jgi:hypothetical protein